MSPKPCRGAAGAESSLWPRSFGGSLGPSGQGLTAMAHPAAPARSRVAGWHRGSPSPGHWARPLGLEWGKSGLGYGPAGPSQ